jgi:hypothetical protein
MFKIIFCLLLVSSCSLLKEDETSVFITAKNFQSYNNKDYLDHAKAYKQFYLNNKNVKILKLTKELDIYLSDIVSNITKKNELFFIKIKNVKINIVDEKIPFHFSTPDETIFLSSALLSKFIKNEDILSSVITYELIRIEKEIYPKRLIIPTGTIGLNRILNLSRLPTNEKMELHKWSYYLTKRANVREDAYLSWIQILNRNSNEFQLLLGDVSSISKEEMQFKAFLIRLGKIINNLPPEEKIVKKFYNLLNYVKKESTYETRNS